MSIIDKALLKGSVCLPLIALAFSGCATVDNGTVVKAGDQVGIHFTCRFPNGEVAATTLQEVIFDKSLKMSPIVLSVLGKDPITITAGEPVQMNPRDTPGFEEEIVRQLTLAVVGMREGEHRSVTLTAETVPVRGTEEQKMTMAKVRHRQKEEHLSREDYRLKKHKEPEVGQVYSEQEPLVGKVSAVTEKDVTITYSPTPGGSVRTPFGPGTIKDLGDRFDIIIDVKPGTLLRSGPIVGKVTEVGKDTFTIDYSNTFFGESLYCDLRPVQLSRAGEGQPSAAKPVPATEAKPAPAAGVTGAADGSREKKQENTADSTGSQEKYQAAKKWINASVADAVKNGKSSVEVDMNDFPGMVGNGDVVTVRFTAKNPDGTPIILPEGFAGQDTPQELVAGKEEVFPGLGEAVVGMAAGEKKEITLSPEKAFGPRDPAKVASYPLKSTIPATITVPAEEYAKRFGGSPATGKDVPMFPYVKATVINAGEKDVTLAISAKHGETFHEPFGTVTLSVGSDGVTVKLDPRMQGAFDTGDQQGVITGIDGEKFTVDYNHPLAGKTILLDLEVVALTKAASIQTKPIEWIEDQAAGLEKAKKDGKPVFLLLYADWCGWCKKTLNETLPDPRIGTLREKFVWMKLNSDKEKKYYEQYGQKGYPLMVVLKPDGTVLKRIDGYKDAKALKAELESSLATL
jgi:FKBP-type peptidyl-prolyl cis-trans isomerase 2